MSDGGTCRCISDVSRPNRKLCAPQGFPFDAAVTWTYGGLSEAERLLGAGGC
jgi:hypothetical protein